MQVYEFDCEECGVFEVARPSVEVVLPEPCPVCGTEAPRVLSAFGRLQGKAEARAPTSRSRVRPRG